MRHPPPLCYLIALMYYVKITSYGASLGESKERKIMKLLRNIDYETPHMNEHLVHWP